MTEDRDYMIDDYLEMPYWIIDILPRRVSKEDGGRYFKVEEYFLKHPEVSRLRQKFCNILLKLNCYYVGRMRQLMSSLHPHTCDRYDDRHQWR